MPSLEERQRRDRKQRREEASREIARRKLQWNKAIADRLDRNLEEQKSNRSELEGHSVAERAFWNEQLNVARRLNRYTAISAIGGFLGLVVLFFTLLDARKTSEATTESNRINRQALIANNRAWLTPNSAEIVSTIDATSNLTIAVIYQNTGKEPALEFTGQEENPGEIETPSGPWFTVFHKDMLKNICDFSPDTKITIYPTSQLLGYRKATAMTLSDDVISGKKTLWFHGCFGYRSPITEEVIQTSEYCFLFSRVVVDGKVTFRSSSCIFGNNAT